MKKDKRKVLKLIQEKKAALTWEVVTEEMPGLDTLYILSLPEQRRHIIRIPSVSGQWRDIELLHELAHATLAERNVLLATAYFEQGTPQSHLDILTPVFRCASDWLADDLLWKWYPTGAGREIEEHAQMLMRLSASAYAFQDLEMLCGGTLIFAEAVCYLGYRQSKVPEPLKKAVAVLTRFFPVKYDIATKQDILNALMEAFGLRYRVGAIKTVGTTGAGAGVERDVWKISFAA